MNSFYMFLPSNVIDITDRNTIGNYVTYLPQNMKLHGDWEVALSEIHYTKTWYNIIEEEEIRLWLRGKGISTNKYMVPAGCYRDIYSVIDEVNKCSSRLLSEFRTLPEEGEPPYSPVMTTNAKNRVVIYTGKLRGTAVMPVFSTKLRKIFGFEDQFDEKKFNLNEYEGDNIKEGYQATNAYDISATINTLYVYCDIVKSSVVGDTLSKLLRVVSVPNSDYGKALQNIYQSPLYFPLDKSEFQSIEIDLKDDTGETLKFEGGRVLAVLHFRKKNE